jgi:hypothetical protein
MRIAFVSLIVFYLSVAVPPNIPSKAHAICRVSRLNNQSLYHNRDTLIFARNDVKMRRRVIIKIHLNTAAVKPNDRGHKWCTSAFIALVQENVDLRPAHRNIMAP